MPHPGAVFIPPASREGIVPTPGGRKSAPPGRHNPQSGDRESQSPLRNLVQERSQCLLTVTGPGPGPETGPGPVTDSGSVTGPGPVTGPQESCQFIAELARALQARIARVTRGLRVNSQKYHIDAR